MRFDKWRVLVQSHTANTSAQDTYEASHGPTLFGHPVGLFTLFFAEMWERFSYYGMRALLVFYCIEGFLKTSEGQAKSIYGAYTALVYMTPFFGGLLADKFIGARMSVVFGGILMALGHLLMTVENATAFYCALALLICGNGFFKPNISSIIGSLYPKDSVRRAGGFTIFYMGINLGATMSPLLCGYIGQTYGWHYGFGLATIGMLIGLAVFVAPTQLVQLFIGAGAIMGAYTLFALHPDDPYTIGLHFATATCLIIAGSVACFALTRGGLPRTAGIATDPNVARKTFPWIVLGVLVFVPVFALLVSGFSIVNKDANGKPTPVVLLSESFLESVEKAPEDANAITKSLRGVAAVFLREIAKPAGLVLGITGIISFGYLIISALRMTKIPRERMFVVLILTFFQMLFWAFFEQAGSSLNLFADQNVDRVFEEQTINETDVGTMIDLQPTQEQVGYTNGDSMFTLGNLKNLREENKADLTFTIPWKVTTTNIGMGIAKRNNEIPAATFQSVNPACILLFGLVFASLWSYLGAHNSEPSTTVKFAIALVQLGLGFGVLVLGAQYATDRGMISMNWLVLCYMIHTTGELCLSPVGLAMITQLTPAKLVSTMMGGWFLATAFSQYLAGIISQFTGGEPEAGADVASLLPADRLSSYTHVFTNVCIAAVICGVCCFCVAPILTKWMHLDTIEEQPEA